ncbi:MAG: ribonuclease HI [Fuerstiella sp.]
MTTAAESLPFVRIYTDGACRGNPGPGGWACILRHPASGKEVELSGGEPETTNNRMELQAVIGGLSHLTRKTKVEVITDSTYVAQGCNSWMAGWKRNGWQRKEGRKLKPVLNVEYWKKLDELLSKHDVKFTVVKGHSGHAENERCDVLAVAAAEAQR